LLFCTEIEVHEILLLPNDRLVPCPGDPGNQAYLSLIGP
jgi:hypothetical protein